MQSKQKDLNQSHKLESEHHQRNKIVLKTFYQKAFWLPNCGSLDNPQPENTDLLCKGKYQCMADFLFDSFGFSCFVVFKRSTDLLVWPNPNQSNKRSAVQWYFPLRSKWVFSGCLNQSNLLSVGQVISFDQSNLWHSFRSEKSISTSIKFNSKVSFICNQREGQNHLFLLKRDNSSYERLSEI